MRETGTRAREREKLVVLLMTFEFQLIHTLKMKLKMPRFSSPLRKDAVDVEHK